MNVDAALGACLTWTRRGYHAANHAFQGPEWGPRRAPLGDSVSLFPPSRK